MISLNSEQLPVAIMQCWQAQLTPFISGRPGGGKSAIIHAVAKQCNLEVIDLRLSQLEGPDMNGFPNIMEHIQKFGYLPSELFPLEGEPLPEGKDGWCLFMDEFNSGDIPVQKASYKVILDHAVGSKMLHPRCVKVAAGNLLTDNAFVEQMSTALASRFVHYLLDVDREAFLRWWSDNNLDHRIESFLNFKPGLFNTFDPDTSALDPTYACSRTWEFTHKLLQTMDLSNPDHGIINLATVAGSISEGVAREFMAFVRSEKEIPSIDKILADPQGTPIPSRHDVVWALSGALAHHTTVKNIDKMMPYIMRMPADIQVITLRSARRRTPELMDTPAFRRWAMEQGTELF
jgi:hypothetical protein